METVDFLKNVGLGIYVGVQTAFIRYKQEARDEGFQWEKATKAVITGTVFGAISGAMNMTYNDVPTFLVSWGLLSSVTTFIDQATKTIVYQIKRLVGKA